MSAPQPGFSGPSLSFGGYTGDPGQLQGVGFWPRAGARVIDFVLHYGVSYVSALFFGVFIAVAAVLVHGQANVQAAVMEALGKIKDSNVLVMFASLLGATTYEIICEAGHGSTLGKFLLGMTVVQEDRTFCRFGSAVVRSLAYFVDALFFGAVAYMEMKGSPQEQRHGDNWAHTIVCKRADLKPEELRGTGRFIAFLALAVVLDAVVILATLTIIIIL